MVIAPNILNLTPVHCFVTPILLFLTPVALSLTPISNKVTPVKSRHVSVTASGCQFSHSLRQNACFLRQSQWLIPFFDCTLTLFLTPPNTSLPASVPVSACGVKHFSPSRKYLTPPTLPGGKQPSESIWRCRLPPYFSTDLPCDCIRITDAPVSHYRMFFCRETVHLV